MGSFESDPEGVPKTHGADDTLNNNEHDEPGVIESGHRRFLNTLGKVALVAAVAGAGVGALSPENWVKTSAEWVCAVGFGAFLGAEIAIAADLVRSYRSRANNH